MWKKILKYLFKFLIWLWKRWRKGKKKIALTFMSCLLCLTGIAMASPTHGSTLALREIEPKQGFYYFIELKGGEYTTIEVTGSVKGGGLDCQLYNKKEDVIADDLDHSVDGCHMKVGITTTDTYRLLITNNGTTKDRMTMMVQ